MRVWLDDLRAAPPGWVRVRTPEEAIALLETGDVTEISLDHDLGLFDGERERTGYDVVAWLEWKVAVEGFVPPGTISVHSANAVAAERMEAGIEAIRRLSRDRPA